MRSERIWSLFVWTEGQNYKQFKQDLLPTFKLSSKAYRKKFTGVQKTPVMSYAEIIAKLKDYRLKWSKGAVVSTSEGMLDLVYLEQLSKICPPDINTWMMDEILWI